MNIMDNVRERFAQRKAKMEQAEARGQEVHEAISAHVEIDQDGKAKTAEPWTPRNRAERRAAMHGQRSRIAKQQPRERVNRRAFKGIMSYRTRQSMFWDCAVPKMAKRARLEAR